MKTLYLGALTSILLLGACATETGNESLKTMQSAQIDSVIVENSTTKDQVRAALGEPEKIDFDPEGHEKWMYNHTRSDFTTASYIPIVNWFNSGTNDTIRSLVIIFNKQGTVMRKAFTTSAGKTEMGLFK